MTRYSRKRVIPRATLTKVAEAEAPGAKRVQLDIPGEGVIEYYTTPLFETETNLRERGKPDWVTGKYRLLPVVRCGDGSLWPEANLWILDSLESKPFPNMHTYASIAVDLAAFRRYIEAEDIDWLNFPPYKLRRPTYRFNAALISSVELGEIAHSTAKRQMATVIRFYRWLMREQVFKPEHPPWSESDRYVGWTNDYGAEKVVRVVTTDVSINIPSEEDTPVGYINDEGRLRPLPESEQKVLLQALKDIDNTEMALIHVFALETGARIQTTLTLRLKHVWRNPSEIFGDELRLRAGPGTGIDTKRDRRGILYIPKWLYERLHIYARSERALRRRLRAVGGDNPDQFLFLSIRGAPLYESKHPNGTAAQPSDAVGHAKAGQAVRQFIKEKLLPEMRVRLSKPNYQFHFHDLKATFGVNLKDFYLERVAKEEMSYSQAFNRLRFKMWHTRLSTTEAYMDFEKNLHEVDDAQDDWNAELGRLKRQALKAEIDENP